MKDKIKGKTWAIHISGKLVEDNEIHQGTLIYLNDILSVVREEINRINIQIHKDIVFCGEEGATI